MLVGWMVVYIISCVSLFPFVWRLVLILLADTLSTAFSSLFTPSGVWTSSDGETLVW